MESLKSCAGSLSASLYCECVDHHLLCSPSYNPSSQIPKLSLQPEISCFFYKWNPWPVTLILIILIISVIKSRVQFICGYKGFSDICLICLPLTDFKNTRWTKASKMNHNSLQSRSSWTIVSGITVWVIHRRKVSPMQYSLTWLLIATCPSIVENKSFRHFLTVLERKYSPVCCRTLTSKTENWRKTFKIKYRTQLSNTDSVSVTVDI